MDRTRMLFWLILVSFFTLWCLRVLYLPSATGTGIFIALLELVRLLILVGFFVIAVRFVFRASLTDAFALAKPSRVGIFLSAIYISSLVFYESFTRILILTPDPWLLLSIPLTAITEELIFRGFVFTYLLHSLGKIQAVLISAVLATLFSFPALIFVAGLTGDAFTAVMSQIFIFSLVQGVIRYYSKSVYPPIVVSMVRLVMMAL